jgi:hypothetical protein
VVALGVCTVVAATAGVLAASGPRGVKTHEEARVAALPNLDIKYPVNWAVEKRGPRLRGMSLDQPVWLVAGPSGRTSLGVARIRTEGGELVPSTFLAAAGAANARPTTVRLGSYRAYRYTDLHPLGKRSLMTVFALPTTQGVHVAMCLSDAARAATFMPRCTAVVATLTLRNGKPLPFRSPAAYRADVNEAIHPLDGIRVQQRAALVRASTPRAQAAAASALSRAYARAANSVAGAAPPPEFAAAHNSVRSSLRVAAAAYGQLAQAARRHNQAAFASARSAVASAETSLQVALARITAG